MQEQDKAERLAAALRANLKRRKGRAREAAEAGPVVDAPPATAADDAAG